MRKTELKRTTTGMVLAVSCVVILLGVLRAGDGARTHQHEGHGHEGGATGAALFQEVGCARCHHAHSRETKSGPGLEGLFDRETLPASGRPVTRENVRRQLMDPYENMPSFADELDPERVRRIVEYLETL